MVFADAVFDRIVDGFVGDVRCEFVMTVGEWNHFRIIMVGSRVCAWLNDQQTVNGEVMELLFPERTSAALSRPDPASNSRRGNFLAQYLSPRNRQRRSEPHVE